MFILLSVFPVSVFIIQLLRYIPLESTETEFNDHYLSYVSKFYYSLRYLIVCLILLYLSYATLLFLPQIITTEFAFSVFYKRAENITTFLLLLTLYRFSTTANHAIQSSLHILANRKARRIAILMPVFAKAVKACIVVFSLRKIAYTFYQTTAWLPKVNTLYHILLILATAWVLLQFIRSLHRVFTLQYSPDLTLDSRINYTHTVIIERVAILVLIILTSAAVLMTFEEVRTVGTGLLISTGVLTAVVGVSSKQPLEGLLRGIQLALAQPIRVNDTVTIEGEVGVVTAINLSHVVVTLWDKRQIFVPTNYFLDKPFENWTHESKELLGTILFHVDYQTPIEAIRQKFNEYLETNELGLWNGGIGLLQVTDIKQSTVEITMLVSADDPDKLFDLRCKIREKILFFIQQSYPDALPKLRIQPPLTGIHSSLTSN